MEKLNFAVIGAGRFGKHYIKNLQSIQGANLFGVAARTKETLNNVRDSVSSSTILTSNCDSMIKNRKVDCVVIATPASTHFGLVKKALEAGKNVLVEKPMVASLKEARSLKAVVKKHKSVFMVGHQYVYNDYVRHLQFSIKNGFIGKPNMVIAQYLYPEPVRNDIGCFWDAGTHYLSIIQYLFNPGNITEVNGKSLSVIGKFDDFTSAAIKFRSGLMASLIVSWLYPEKTRKFMVLGSRKTAVFDDAEEKDKLKYFPVSGKIKNNSIYDYFGGRVKSIIPNINAKDSIRNEIMHFVNCVRNNRKPLTDIDHSYQVTEWLDTISRAIRLPGYK